jgi:DHA2 family multidrug resistance protein-like MFS transporter
MARATLSGAVDVARTLPAAAGAPMAHAAQAAFVRGLQVCAWISTVGSLLLAVFAAVALRNRRGVEAAAQPA